MLTIDNNVIKCPFLTSSLAISPRPDGLAGDQIHWQAKEILKKELEIHVPIEGGRQLRFNLLSVVCIIQQEQDKFLFPH